MEDAWMASAGRHSVDLGPSLVRSLKARSTSSRKQSKTKIPTNDFYSFRYTFKPDSVDDTKIGQLTSKHNSENSFRIEKPSSQHQDDHLFSGEARPAREWECVLILDEETGTYTLEKLDSSVVLSYEGRTGVKHERLQDDQSPVHDAFIKVASEPQREASPHIPAEEEEEEEQRAKPLRTTVPQLQRSQRRSSGSIAKTSNPQSVATASKGRIDHTRPGKAVKGAKREETPSSKVSSARQAPRKRSAGGAPITQNGTPPPAGPSHIPPKASEILLPPKATPQPFTSHYEGSSEGSAPRSDEEDEDMEPVFEEEVDVDEFALELDQSLMAEDESSNANNHAAADSTRPAPVSLNQYAGGQNDGVAEDDEYSSSEDDSD